MSTPIATKSPVKSAINIATVKRCRVFPVKLFPRLRLLGEIFANALIRKNNETELERAFQEIIDLKKQAETENLYLREEIEQEYDFHNMIGQSDGFKSVISKIRKIAFTDTTVLITGETGTGKELVARAIHSISSRGKRPMVKANCAALAQNMIENELFGHEKGAYTTAYTSQGGRFEMADGNTLFLDEIGELPIESQAKLLRVLQEGELERIGSSRTIKVDVRVIAATNRNLEREVRNGRFREDLWYRLNVFPIHVPPLRERIDDISLLADWFTQKFNRKQGKNIRYISADTLENLKRHPWPGNIRELENVIERAVINSDGRSLQLVDTLTDCVDRNVPLATLEETERNHILQVLNDTDWRVEGPKGAALILAVNPSTLRSRMKKLKITKQNRNASLN